MSKSSGALRKMSSGGFVLLFCSESRDHFLLLLFNSVLRDSNYQMERKPSVCRRDGVSQVQSHGGAAARRSCVPPPLCEAHNGNNNSINTFYIYSHNRNGEE